LSLQIEQQETENRELKLTVRVDEKRVQEAIRRETREMARKARIPGFRRGKAPMHIFQRWVGKEALRAHAVDSMQKDILDEVSEQVEALLCAPGKLDDVELDPLVFYLTLPLLPKVDLGDYRQVRVEPSEIGVPDVQMNKAMERLREQHVLVEPVDRPAAMGDIIIADIHAVKDGEVVFERESAELLLDPEKLYAGTPFVKNIIGMSAGQVRSFELTSLTDETDVRDYTVTVQDVKERYLPPLNDDLALDEGYETLLEMRMDVRRQLAEDLKPRADAEYADQVLAEIRKGVTVTYSQVFLEQTIDQMIERIEENLKQQKWTLEDYLKTRAKTMESLRKELRPEAIEQVEVRHTVDAFLRAEGLSADKVELEQFIDTRLGEMDQETSERIREIFSSDQGRQEILSNMLAAKFSERLKAIGRGQAPELPDPLEEEE